MFSMVHTILQFCGKHAWRIRIAYLFTFLKSFFANAPIVAAVFLVDRLLAGRATLLTCLVTAGVLLGLLALQAMFQNLADRFQSATGYRVFAEKRIAFGEHLRRLPMGYFSEGNMGKISSILSQDMVFIEENSMGVVADVISNICSQVILTAFLFYMDVRLGLLALATELVVFVISRFMMRTDNRCSVQRQESIEGITDAIIEYADGFAVSKSFNRTGASSEELRRAMHQMTETNLTYEKKHMPYQRMMNIVMGIGIAAILAVSIYLWQEAWLTPGKFFGVMLFLKNMFTPLKHLYELDTRFAIMNVSLNRINSVFAEAPLADTGCESLPEEGDEDVPEIAFRHVHFGYGEEEILHDISFEVRRGQMIALIGQSGSGKTTIANLLARFWDTKEGEILLRGTDIRNLPMATLMGQLSMVFQRVYLFQDTVYNNIAVAKPDATREEVHEAARKARCYDFIMDLPYGFDTVIGEGGSTLSGGEAQRISIARCILKDAPIIILDEATASIDADNESKIQEAMTQLCRGKTTIVIAHRLNTIQNADCIILIDAGRIAGSGSHSELRQTSEQYRRQLALQQTGSWAKAREVNR